MLMMGATAMPNLPTMECKVRVTLSYPTHKVFVKVSKRSVVDMASKLTSKVARTIKNLLVSSKDKDPMVNKSSTIYWYQCGDLGCDDEYIGGNLQDLRVKDTKSTWRPPLPFIIIVSKLAIPLTKITSK